MEKIILLEGEIHKEIIYNNSKGKSNSRERGRSSSKGSGSSRRCFYCNKPGCIKKDYYAWQRKNKEKSVSSNGNESQESVNLGDGYDSA